jgi:hypothetical protein
MTNSTDIDRVLALLRTIEEAQVALQAEQRARPYPTPDYAAGHTDGYVNACTGIRIAVEQLVAAMGK